MGLLWLSVCFGLAWDVQLTGGSRGRSASLFPIGVAACEVVYNYADSPFATVFVLRFASLARSICAVFVSAEDRGLARPTRSTLLVLSLIAYWESTPPLVHPSCCRWVCPPGSCRYGNHPYCRERAFDVTPPSTPPSAFGGC